MNSKKTLRIISDLLHETAGSLLIAVAIHNFALAAEFPMTGFSGIAIILNRFFHIPIGISTILLNLPVALLCYRKIGRSFLLKSVRCMIISSFFIDYLAPLFPFYTGPRLLAALVTGVLGGIGYAIIYTRGSSTGGADFLTGYLTCAAANHQEHPGGQSDLPGEAVEDPLQICFPLMRCHLRPPFIPWITCFCFRSRLFCQSCSHGGRLRIPRSAMPAQFHVQVQAQ